MHPGGPFFSKKDEGSWSIPKGEFSDNEDALEAAIREFGEETGYLLKGHFIPLKPILQKSGKLVYAWAINHTIDEEKIISNTFELEWPPHSGKFKAFPEVDKAGWFNEATARKKIIRAQSAFIDEIISIIERGIPPRLVTQ